MKGLGSFILAVAIAFGAAGCTEDVVTTTSNDPPNPDVVTKYKPPSNNADAVAFEEVSVVLGTTPKFEGYVRNVGSVTSELFKVAFNIKDGDVAVQDTKEISLTPKVIDPGMRVKFSESMTLLGHTQGTLTYWGLDGTKTTQKYTINF